MKSLANMKHSEWSADLGINMGQAMGDWIMASFNKGHLYMDGALVTADGNFKAVRRIAALLEKEEVAFDIAGHRDAPAGLRIWGGPTVEAGDIALMLPWIEWAHAIVQGEHAAITQAAE